MEPDTPCPGCLQGRLVHWPDVEVKENRYVQRILNKELVPLVAGEHTAQVTGDQRINLEDRFKAKASVSPLNVLSCSPTLEMGIDVGGLDAVALRNIPPRPDNYAQRGGRAGRRSRVGIVLGYARNTPHDGYFYDKPAEMIGGEVAAPGVGLGNRDVTLRHLHAMVFGAAEPGFAGQMAEYITIQGELKQEPIAALIAALEAKFNHRSSRATRLRRDPPGLRPASGTRVPRNSPAPRSERRPCLDACTLWRGATTRSSSSWLRRNASDARRACRRGFHSAQGVARPS